MKSRKLRQKYNTHKEENAFSMPQIKYHKNIYSLSLPTESVLPKWFGFLYSKFERTIIQFSRWCKDFYIRKRFHYLKKFENDWLELKQFQMIHQSEMIFLCWMLEGFTAFASFHLLVNSKCIQLNVSSRAVLPVLWNGKERNVKIVFICLSIIPKCNTTYPHMHQTYFIFLLSVPVMQ